MMGCRDSSEIKLQTPQKSSLNVKALVSKQARLDSNGKPSTSLRWNPTPEQLFALEELYRCGTQSPSAQQIQQITCRLRRFGKIEGKNVFYWFQNHKARERQKRYREIKCVPREKYWTVGSSFGKINEIGLSKKSQEFQQAKMWMPPRKSRNTHPNQECLSMSTPSIPNKIRHFRVFNSVDGLFSKQTAWKSMESSFSPANPSSIAAHLTNTSLKTSSEIQGDYLRKVSGKNVEDNRVEIQTLELFPLQSSSEGGGTRVKFAGDIQKPMDNNLSSRLFFEFLPLKN